MHKKELSHIALKCLLDINEKKVKKIKREKEKRKKRKRRKKRKEKNMVM